MNRNKALILAVLALFVLALGAFAGGKQEGAKPGGALFPMKVIFPRSLEVLDDYYLTVALKMKYFEDEGIQALPEGALGTTDAPKLVVQGFGEVCLPAPPVLMTAVANDLPLTMVFEQDKNYIFGFGVRKDSGINSFKDLKGKKISVGDAGWTVIIDPLLMKTAGFTTKDTQIVVGGTGRAQLVQEGKADAVLTWEKEYQLWWGQGLDLKILKGYDQGVRFPGNGLTFSNKFIKEHPDRVVGFGRAWAKGIYFGQINPAAATEITLERYPMIGVPFADAILAIKAGVWIMTAGPVVEKYGLGYLEKTHWAEMRDTLFDQGALPKKVDIDSLLTNKFIDEINKFDHKKVEEQAKAYKLKPESLAALKKLGLNEYGW